MWNNFRFSAGNWWCNLRSRAHGVSYCGALSSQITLIAPLWLVYFWSQPIYYSRPVMKIVQFNVMVMSPRSDTDLRYWMWPVLGLTTIFAMASLWLTRQFWHVYISRAAHCKILAFSQVCTRFQTFRRVTCVPMYNEAQHFLCIKPPPPAASSVLQAMNKIPSPFDLLISLHEKQGKFALRTTVPKSLSPWLLFVVKVKVGRPLTLDFFSVD